MMKLFPLKENKKISFKHEKPLVNDFTKENKLLR